MSVGSFLWYAGFFLLALGILIVIHELGHYLVARAIGVKVLRFSIGFGKPLISRRYGIDGTEWVLAAFPLGGYVKMLDEREGSVSSHELHRAFNRQSVGRRASVVVAGPLANLLLAILLYSSLFMTGMQEFRPILGTPLSGTIAAQAGVEAGDEVISVSGKQVISFQDFRWLVMQHLVDRENIDLEIKAIDGEIRHKVIGMGPLVPSELDADFIERLGLYLNPPHLLPIIGAISSGSVAERAGMLQGDRIVSINGTLVSTWSDMARMIRENPLKPIDLVFVRNGVTQQLSLIPEAIKEAEMPIGRIGVGVQAQPEVMESMMLEIRLGAGDAFARAVIQTWDTSVLTLRMIGRMLIGEQSWRNISGPVTIADYAGQSARMGIDHFLKFLALISISLGVLNLLPVPVLDGGHLLYYLFEAIKGGPLSERVMEIGQQLGLGLLAILMVFAFFNDINRLLAG